MNDQPNMTPPAYSGTPSASSPEQDVLASLQAWARTNAWAARVAARKAREYHQAMQADQDRARP